MLLIGVVVLVLLGLIGVFGCCVCRSALCVLGGGWSCGRLGAVVVLAGWGMLEKFGSNAKYLPIDISDINKNNNISNDLSVSLVLQHRPPRRDLGVFRHELCRGGNLAIGGLLTNRPP